MVDNVNPTLDKISNFQSRQRSASSLSPVEHITKQDDFFFIFFLVKFIKTASVCNLQSECKRAHIFREASTRCV